MDPIQPPSLPSKTARVLFGVFIVLTITLGVVASNTGKSQSERSKNIVEGLSEKTTTQQTHEQIDL